jgi:hypothetical protein
MIFRAADDEGLAVVMGENPAKVAMQFLAERFIAQQWPAVFGRENCMHQNLGEGLRHGPMMVQSILS